MSSLETIGFAVAEVYCKVCGDKQIYNYYKPFTAPRRCKKCGGEMTDKETEKFEKEVGQLLLKNKKLFEKLSKM